MRQKLDGKPFVVKKRKIGQIYARSPVMLRALDEVRTLLLQGKSADKYRKSPGGKIIGFGKKLIS